PGAIRCGTMGASRGRGEKAARLQDGRGVAQRDHAPDAALKGVLLVNLGTPAAPTPEAVRRYLAEFLSDPRVVQIPRWLWLPILHGIILRTRPARSAKKYAAIWTPEGSPLAVHTRHQAQLLG